MMKIIKPFLATLVEYSVAVCTILLIWLQFNAIFLLLIFIPAAAAEAISPWMWLIMLITGIPALFILKYFIYLPNKLYNLKDIFNK